MYLSLLLWFLNYFTFCLPLLSLLLWLTSGRATTFQFSTYMCAITTFNFFFLVPGCICTAHRSWVDSFSFLHFISETHRKKQIGRETTGLLHHHGVSPCCGVPMWCQGSNLGLPPHTYISNQLCLYVKSTHIYLMHSSKFDRYTYLFNHYSIRN